MNGLLFILIAIPAITLVEVAGTVLGVVIASFWWSRFVRKESRKDRDLNLLPTILAISIVMVTASIITSMTTFGLLFILAQEWSPTWTLLNLLGFFFIGSMTLFEGIRLTFPKKRWRQLWIEISVSILAFTLHRMHKVQIEDMCTSSERERR